MFMFSWQVHAVVGVLGDDTDPMVTVMKLEKAPQETYADIGNHPEFIFPMCFCKVNLNLLLCPSCLGMEVKCQFSCLVTCYCGILKSDTHWNNGIIGFAFQVV